MARVSLELGESYCKSCLGNLENKAGRGVGLREVPPKRKGICALTSLTFSRKKQWGVPSFRGV